MKKTPSISILFFVLITSCQVQEVATPISVIASETPIPFAAELPTHAPTPIICEPKSPIVELESLPIISNTTTPAPQLNPEMAFDQSRKIIVLFSGFPASGTWEYDGMEWREIMTTTYPTERTESSITYDSKRKNIVMYGDFSDETHLYDLWEYDGVNWRDSNVLSIPEKIRFPVLIYYPPWGKIIMFGEYQDSATYQTWVYDGIVWENLNQDLPDIPMPSMLYQTVYDSCRQKLYLIMMPGWLYEFDGTWQLLNNSSENRLRITPSSVVYDSFRDRLVHFGATWENFEDPWQSETWEFDGVKWNQVNPLISPPPRTAQSIIFDEGRGVTVLFGGKTQDGTLLNDLWEYDGTTWVQR